jgi:LysR family transcriptional regulator, low CO2-responsive transcriptional regulator
MPLGLNQLRVFEAVARCGSFVKAAARLAVTPPAVSLQMRLLEAACGAPLFERAGRRIRLTAAGETLADYSARIFALVADAEGAVARDHRFAHARLRLVSGAGVAAYYLPPLWTAITRRYPDLQMQISVANSARVVEQLVALEADMGVLDSEHAHPELSVVPLVRDPLVVVVARDHPWARRRSVSVRALQGERIILREPGSSLRSIVEHRMRSLGLRCQVAMEISSNEVIKRAVELGNGVSVMSRAMVQREIDGGYVHALAFRERGFSRTLHLACHRQRESSPLVRAVRDIAASLRRVPAVRASDPDRRPR